MNNGARTIDSASRAIFDVLYEANEPLEINVIVERSFELVDFAVLNHVRRVYLRMKQSDRQLYRKHSGVDLVDPDEIDTGEALPDARTAWERGAKIRIRAMARRGHRILRVGPGERYAPNPDSPPLVESDSAAPRRSTVSLTREMWLVLRAEETTAGAIGVMKTQIGGVVVDPLLSLERAARFFRGGSQRLTDRERRFFELAATDEARRWLLHELVDRS